MRKNVVNACMRVCYYTYHAIQCEKKKKFFFSKYIYIYIYFFYMKVEA